MQAFHNDPAIKAKYVARVIAHRQADHLIRGTGWDGHKGCAVGCTLENYEHAQYPVELGIPEWLARVEDTLFEGMNAEKAQLWPEQFLQAVPVGLTEEQFERKVKAPFLIVVLKSVLDTFDHDQFPDVKKAVEGSIALWERSDIGTEAWGKKAVAAVAAARAAAEAAVRAAEAAEAAAAVAAVRAAEAAVAAVAVAARAARAARAAKYNYFAGELIKILEDAV